VAIVVIALLALVNLALPTQWAQLTMHHGPFAAVAGIHPLNGPFQHPAALSRFSVILAVACLAYLFVVRARFSVLLLLVIAAGLAVLSFETKSLVGLILVAVLFAIRFARVRGVVVVVCLAPLVIAALAPLLVRFIGRDVTAYVVQTSARGRLTTGGADIANHYFPFGAGLGRWASSTAATDYSPEYVARSFQHVYGLGPGTAGKFLNDTQWPAIYGEAGWIGGAAFALGLILMLVALLRRTSRNEDVLVRWLRVAGVGWMIALIVESAVAPVFVSTPSFPFVFAAAGIIASIRRDGLLPDPIRVLRPSAAGGAARPATATR
ncbi:hypothetical protein, partial [Amnibacterium sp.]|uniref:hypothetical protein n=1 Tax=Amnibacterium sp. TaxID=1872496 RepID=UPI00261B5F45